MDGCVDGCGDGCGDRSENMCVRKCACGRDYGHVCGHVCRLVRVDMCVNMFAQVCVDMCVWQACVSRATRDCSTEHQHPLHSSTAELALHWLCTAKDDRRVPENAKNRGSHLILKCLISFET